MPNFVPVSDVSEWFEFVEVMRDVQRSVPEIQGEFLQDLASRLIEGIMEIAVSQGNVFTGTYLQSLSADITTGDHPTMTLGFSPQGEGADRLPIYWRVLETGAQPNPAIPEGALIEWAAVKFGNPYLGILIANSNRAMLGGISPNPILSHLFVFSSDLIPIGLTPRGMSLLELSGEKFKEGLEEVTFRAGPRAGQRQKIVRTPRGPRFGPAV